MAPSKLIRENLLVRLDNVRLLRFELIVCLVPKSFW